MRRGLMRRDGRGRSGLSDILVRVIAAVTAIVTAAAAITAVIGIIAATVITMTDAIIHIAAIIIRDNIVSRIE